MSSGSVEVSGVAGTQQWRGAVNGVLYVVQFEPVLDEQVVATTADQLVARPMFDQPVQRTLDQLREGLASGEQLTGVIPQPHEEAAVRDFVGRLVDRLESMRPFPVPAYRKLPAHSHGEVLSAPAVGRVAYDWKQAADRLRRGIERVDDRAVLVLQLDSGDVVALVDDWDITPAGGHRDGESALLSASPKPAAELVDAFRAATGFTADEVTAL
jgi:hypothetical protein